MNDIDICNLLVRDRSSYEIIPLGTNCAISHYLRKINLRNSAFPFDWNVVPIQSAIKLIENEFSDFLKRKNLIFLPPVFRLLFNEYGTALEMKNEFVTPVVCEKYQMLFPHDFPKQGKRHFESVRKKYQRRTARLMELLLSTKHVIFIHHDGALNDWQYNQYLASQGTTFSNNPQGWKTELSNILDKNYPKLSFSLLDLHEFVSIVSRT